MTTTTEALRSRRSPAAQRNQRKRKTPYLRPLSDRAIRYINELFDHGHTYRMLHTRSEHGGACKIRHALKRRGLITDKDELTPKAMQYVKFHRSPDNGTDHQP
jgi:hypothetical protein